MWEEISPHLAKSFKDWKVNSKVDFFTQDTADCCRSNSLKIFNINSEGWGRISSHICPVSCEQVQDAACHSIRTATPSIHSYTGLEAARVPRHRRVVRYSSSHTTTRLPAHSGGSGSGSAAVGVVVGQRATWVAPLRCGHHDHHRPLLGSIPYQLYPSAGA